MNADDITTAIDSATAAILESSPWLRDLPTRAPETAPDPYVGTSVPSDPQRRRTAVQYASRGTCPPACRCSPLLHALPPRVSLYKPSHPTYPTGGIVHFPTCSTCGNSYSDGRPCH